MLVSYPDPVHPLIREIARLESRPNELLDTIVFQPDGFDAFDLSLQRLSRQPELRRARVIRYRSREWRRYFETLVGAAR